VVLRNVTRRIRGLGVYQYTRMPQGFKNSPSIFQMIMDKELNEFIDKKCCVYLDDIIIFGNPRKNMMRI
jgi:hypothetical protein